MCDRLPPLYCPPRHKHPAAVRSPALRCDWRYAWHVRSLTHVRIASLALGGMLTLAGCYSLAEPSFEPGDQRDVLQSIARRGIVISEPLTGKTACDDPDLVGNSLYLAARMPDEEEPRDVYVHSYREKFWDESIEEVDRCMAEYAAANPGSDIGRFDIPTFRVFGADWSEALTDQLIKAFEEASQAGKIG